MSFSSNVKSELLHCFGEEQHCDLLELTAVLNLCGQIIENENKICVKVQTENVVVARKSFTLIKKNFKIDCSITVRRNSQLKKNRVYILSAGENESKAKMLELLERCGIYRNGLNCIEFVPAQNELFYGTCCRKAYIRGAFLASGSINDPEKTYHMEFVSQSEKFSLRLMEVINSFGIESKCIHRKEHFVVYIKDGEQISDLLNIMGAHVSLMDFENIRILKDMRNNVNRKVNCETANLNKTVNAAVKQIEDIEFIRDNYGLSYLPPALYNTAVARLEYPDASLKELGEKMSPPVGKSGINHRLHKISDIAKELMKGMG